MGRSLRRGKSSLELSKAAHWDQHCSLSISTTFISFAVREGESAIDLTNSILSLFADDTKWGRFQNEIDKLGEWSKTWQLHFNTDKCKIMQLGKKNIRQTYTMEGNELKKSKAEKDIGLMV